MLQSPATNRSSRIYPAAGCIRPPNMAKPKAHDEHPSTRNDETIAILKNTRGIQRVLESRRRRTKGSVVGEEWCQNVAPLRWYTKNFFVQSKMILSRAWLHDTVSCAAWNDARKGVYLKPLFKTPCSNCYWGWSKPIMLDYRDISLMESVPLMWGPVTASPVGIEPMTIF